MMEKIKAGEITGQTGDYMLRATAANGQIRAFAATSRDLVEKARQAHNTSPVATAALGRLMTAGVMMGSMMKADSDLLTIRVEGDGPIGGLTVTADKIRNKMRLFLEWTMVACQRGCLNYADSPVA